MFWMYLQSGNNSLRICWVDAFMNTSRNFRAYRGFQVWFGWIFGSKSSEASLYQINFLTWEDIYFGVTLWKIWNPWTQRLILQCSSRVVSKFENFEADPKAGSGHEHLSTWRWRTRFYALSSFNCAESLHFFKAKCNVCGNVGKNNAFWLSNLIRLRFGFVTVMT